MRALAGKLRRGRGWTVLGVALAAGLVGCGGDSTLAVGEAKSEAAAYCEKSLALETAPEPDFDFESATPEQQVAAAKQFASQFLTLAEQGAAVAPAEIKPDIDLLTAAVRTVAQTGDFSVFESDPAITAAEDRAHAFDLDNCGWGKAEITADDYSFEGLPKKSEAGPVSFDLSNEGEEAHHLVLFRVKDGVDETLDELLALPEEESTEKTEMAGGVEPIEPGDKDYSVVDLTKGRYVVVCFLPVGGVEEGPPHFEEGMKGEFEVV